MKPRNKFEKAVLAQSDKLHPLSKTQLSWAFRECVSHFAHRLPKGRTTCMDCGHEWVKKKATEHCVCPKCHAKLKVKNTLVRKVKQKSYFTVLAKCGEYQTLRMFLLVVEMEKGCKAHPYALEIGQYWWNDKGKQTLVAIQRILGRYLDSFSFISPMAIREDKKDVFRHLATFDTYPKYTAIDTLKRNGFDGNLHDVAPARLITALLTDPKAETLMKAGQYDLLRHCLHSSTRLDDYWPSVKICLRNGYTITDGSMWCDTIDLLKRMGKDIRCPKYVCPADLKAEHDKLVEQRNHKEERERLALRRKEAAQYEKGYLSQKGKFFGILITDGTLNVRVLESVAEIAEEGTLMHHCVYANAYYRKDNSLILSATIGNKRIETVEVDLKKLCVVQSRGVCNQNTEYHDRIVNLVNSNMNLIRQRIRT